MEAQLQLIPSPDGSTDRSGSSADWRLDAATRARGRAGIALARQALSDARRGSAPTTAADDTGAGPTESGSAPARHTTAA